MCLWEKKTTSQAQKEAGLHKMTIIKKINEGRRMSLLLTENKTYRVNEKIWPDARECLLEIRKCEESIDPRVPVDSIIYFKNDNEIVFSNKKELDATLTAFSAYENYGIGLLTTTYYYCLPKKHLTTVDVFMHSLHVTEKDMDVRHIILAALFFAKFRKELGHIQHPIVENIRKVLAGEKIRLYPSQSEIRDRADVYNIEVSS